MCARAAPWTLLLALAACVPGCGRGSSEPGASATNRTTWQSTLDAALDALGRHDYRALHALLTPYGRQALESDLTYFGQMVAHPVEGPRLMAKVRQRWPEVPDALVEGARAGRIVDAWALFLGGGVPRGQRPEPAGMRLDPAQTESVLAFYRYPGGPQLPVELKRLRGEWSVDKISLGSP